MSKKILLSSFLITVLPLTTTVISCSNSSKNENPSPEYHENTKFNTNLTQASQLGLEDYLAQDALKIITNEFCFSKLDVFLSGDVSLIKSASDIEVTPMINIANSNKIDINFSIKPGKWYFNNKVQNTPSTTKTYVLSGFKETPTEPVESLDKQGGNIDDVLYADKYKIIAEKLGLNQYDDISLLNIDDLNNKLHSYSQFNKINLSLAEDSSTKLGQLKLTISGLFNNYPIETDTFTISNFFKLDQNITLSINAALELNKTNWFENQKPITTSQNKDINNITNVDWFSKYLKDFAINDANLSLNETVIDLLMKLITFNFSLVNDEININFSGSYQNKKYENNEWIADGNEIRIYQSQSTGVNKLALPTLDDFKTYVIELITINEELLKTHYASYYQGVNKINTANSTPYVFDEYISNYDQIINKYKDDYFSNKQINFAINNDGGGIRTYDSTGRMEFNLYVLDQDDPTNKIYNKNFEILQMKSLDNFINSNLTNSVLIRQNGSVYNELINKMKENQEQITNLFDQAIGEKIEIELIDFKLLNNVIWFNDEEKTFGQFLNNFNNLKNKFIPTIFNHEITPIEETSISAITQYQIGYLSNLYNPNGNEEDLFMIVSVGYSTESQLKMKIVKETNGLKIEIEGQTIILFDDLYNENRFDTSFYFKLSKSEWDNIIANKF